MKSMKTDKKYRLLYFDKNIDYYKSIHSHNYIVSRYFSDKSFTKEKIDLSAAEFSTVFDN